MANQSTKNPIVWLAAKIVSSILGFLGFGRPSWVREALGGADALQTAPAAAEQAPALARQAIAVEKPESPRRSPSRTASKPRAAASKKAKPVRTAKKISSQRTARERTESLRSSL